VKETEITEVTGQGDLRQETLNYLAKDLNSLLEIFGNCPTHLWVYHNLELTDCLTNSSLAKLNFFKSYLNNGKIPLIITNNLFTQLTTEELQKYLI
jgi:hypothetical protein